MPLEHKKARQGSSEREEFAIRIRQLATLVGGPKHLAQRAGLSRAVIGKYLAGKSEPSRDRLVKLAAAGRISVRWLATGEEEMIPGADRFVRSLPLTPPLAAGQSERQGGGNRMVDALAFEIEWIRETFLADPGRMLLLRISGDSMAPSIQHGDLLLLELSESPFKQDGVYAISHSGELVLKRVVKRIDGTFEIRCDNPVFGSAESVHPDEVKIVGRALWFGRRL